MPKDSLSFYPEYIRKDCIHIPSVVLNFFKSNTVKFSGHKEKMPLYVPLPRDNEKSLAAITYSNAVGRNATAVPPEYFKEEYLMETVEEYEFHNLTEKDELSACKVINFALRRLFGYDEYSIASRKYMINTSTMPIRVNYAKSRDKPKWPVYFKRPDTSRILGKWLYDISSGFEPNAYMFNRAVFIEDSIKGTVLSQMDEEELLKRRDYRDGLVRANEHANFLELPDVVRKRNRIVKGHDTVLFDFNLMFLGPKFQNDLLEKYQAEQGGKFKWFNPPWVTQTIRQERHLIAERVIKRENDFFSLIEVMENVRDISGKTFCETAREKYCTKSLEDLFMNKLEAYSNS